jgi:hypothetical protein
MLTLFEKLPKFAAAPFGHVNGVTSATHELVGAQAAALMQEVSMTFVGVTQVGIVWASSTPTFERRETSASVARNIVTIDVITFVYNLISVVLSASG